MPSFIILMLYKVLANYFRNMKNISLYDIFCQITRNYSPFIKHKIIDVISEIGKKKNINYFNTVK